MSTENSPRLWLFPRHPLRSRTVGQACRLLQRQAWGQKEPFNPGYTLARPHLAPITLACGSVTGTAFRTGNSTGYLTPWYTTSIRCSV